MNLALAKATVAEDFAPGHPGREALLALPDQVSERNFDETFPLLLRLLRTPWVGDGPARSDPPGHGGAGAISGARR